LTSATIDHGWRVPAVKWLMVEGVFVGGVGIYAFYALQPYLLKLYGDPDAYQVAGLVAAIVAGAQIIGGVAAPRIRGMFHRRTSALLLTASIAVVTLALIGSIDNFYAVIGLIVVWALLSSASRPIRQTYLNGLIPSTERASILSFDSMMASLGGVGIQPALGRTADVWGYGSSYVVGAAISAVSIPFLLLSRKENAPADTVEVAAAVEPLVGAAGVGPATAESGTDPSSDN
jgi:MFS family permease